MRYKVTISFEVALREGEYIRSLLNELTRPLDYKDHRITEESFKELPEETNQDGEARQVSENV